jgi:hypothetical protein
VPLLCVGRMFREGCEFTAGRYRDERMMMCDVKESNHIDPLPAPPLQTLLFPSLSCPIPSPVSHLSVSMALNSVLNIVIWAGVRENATASSISFLNRESRMKRPREFIWGEKRGFEIQIKREELISSSVRWHSYYCVLLLLYPSQFTYQFMCDNVCHHI